MCSRVVYIMTITPTKKYPQETIDFLINNFPVHGSAYCAAKLGSTSQKIASYCRKHGIKHVFVPKYKPVEMDQFYNIVDPKVAYWLGLMWADGHVPKGNHSHISMNLVKADAENVYPIIKDIMDFAIYDVPKENSPSKPQTQFAAYDKNLKKFLSEMDYPEKSFVSATKILQHIPIKLHRFFFLGFLDGDGCICKTRENSNIKFSLLFCGTQNQNWSFAQEFIENCNCSWKIYKRNPNIGAGYTGSAIRVGAQFEAWHICSILYQSYKKDKIGLNRKYQSFLELQRDCKVESRAILGFRGVIKLKSSKNFYAKHAGKNISTHSNPTDAAMAYDKHMVNLLGINARTNFPLSNYISIGKSEIYD
jgi:hypothetical protein